MLRPSDLNLVLLFIGGTLLLVLGCLVWRFSGLLDDRLSRLNFGDDPLDTHSHIDNQADR